MGDTTNDPLLKHPKGHWESIDDTRDGANFYILGKYFKETDPALFKAIVENLHSGTSVLDVGIQHTRERIQEAYCTARGFRFNHVRIDDTGVLPSHLYTMKRIPLEKEMELSAKPAEKVTENNATTTRFGLVDHKLWITHWQAQEIARKRILDFAEHLTGKTHEEVNKLFYTYEQSIEEK
jgi:hypothetical protein